MFFLLSGSTIWRNNKNADWKYFYCKHLIKLFLPIWVSYSLFAVAYYSKHGMLCDVSAWQIIIPLFGGNFFTPEIQRYLGFTTLNLVGEWFTSVILILYLLYPFLKRGFQSRMRPLITVLVCVLFCFNFRFYFLIYQNGHISLTLGLLYFWIGMYFEEYRDILQKKRISIIALIGAIVIWVINPDGLFGVAYLPNVLVILLLYLASFSIYKTTGWLRWICKYSYIVYLIHHTLMNWLIPVMGTENMTSMRVMMMFFILILLIFSVGISENVICYKINGLFKEIGNLGKKKEEAI